MPPNQTIDRKARLFALFGDPTRLNILQVISKQQPVNVTEIAQAVKMSPACTSHHLQLLKDNQVVRTERRGNSIYYQLSNKPFIRQLQNLI